MKKQVRGSDLTFSQQKAAKSLYVHRFTKEHRPGWVIQGEWKTGVPYPVQFESDSDWLDSTLFTVNSKGGISGPCESSPTWPDNPELRKP